MKISRPGKYQNLLTGIRNSILNNRFVKKIAGNYPRTYTFILDRFSLLRFNGLPLTFLAASFIANFLLLSEIVETFENSSFLVSIDKSFAHFLFAIRIPFIANAFFYFSKLGTLPVLVIITLITGAFLFFKQKKPMYMISLVVALLGTGLTVLTGKLYFHRERPDGLSFYNETSYSFPSGHATVAVAFYGLLFYFIIRSVKTYTQKFKLTAFAILFVSLLGFSRLYLCVHYLSDVLAGYSLGLLWLLFAISILEWKIYNKQ